MNNGNNDWIRIPNLKLRCCIGVTPRERRRRQTITAEIAMNCDLRSAGRSDRLEDTVDYTVISEAIALMTIGKTFHLLESLAEQIAKICLANSKVKEITVKVAKKCILPNISSAEVEIIRKRE